MSKLCLCISLCRVCLTSCCAVLWARPDITGSFALWGDVDTWATRKSRELANWLLRRRAGLRRLRLDFTSLPCDPAAPALKALCAAAWLTELTLLSVRDASPTTWAALTMLPRLSRLEVRYSCLRSVPAGLPPSLVSLGLSGNKQLGEEGAAAFDALERLPGITRLDLSSCGLRALPPQLESTTALAELRLSGNPLLGEASGAAFQPLRALDSLTRLDFWACSLRSVPWQLSGLTGLVDLSLAGSKLGGREAEGAFLALGELAGLRRLDMSHCGLAALPPQLGLLAGMQHLKVSFNEGLREGGSEAFDALRELGALTRLGLRMCALQRMPWQLSQLRELQELDASFNWALGKEGAIAFTPLERLPALSRLDLSSSCIGSLPSQLSHLANSLS